MDTSSARNDSAVCKALRQKIQAVRIKRLGWSDYVFHFVMNGLGYGESLRALDEAQLTGLWDKIKDYRKHGRTQEYNYDKQGKYMFHLQKRAGWDDRTLMAYLTITYQKTHWNLLTDAEKRAVIQQLQAITEKE